MSTNPFKKAVKSQEKLRLALMGASGSGKTYSALAIARAFGRIALIDTEHGSASKYGDRFDFDTLALTNYHPQQYIDAIQLAGEAGEYDVLVIDSLSHAWNGAGGVLEIVDRTAQRTDAKNKFSAWRDATPLHNQLIEALLSVPLHLIVTMRSKTEYVMEKDERGKTVPRKVGTAPIQRDGMEYEFDVVGELDMTHTMLVSKTRITPLEGKAIEMPGAAFGKELFDWLNEGEPIHWAKDAAGRQFNARMKALNLTSEYVLAFLEPDHPLERLSHTRMSESEAFSRLDELAKQQELGHANGANTPPRSSPTPTRREVTVVDDGFHEPAALHEPDNAASDDPLVSFGMEQGADAMPIGAAPREALSDDDPNRRGVDCIVVTRSGKSKAVAFGIVNSRNRIPVMGEHNLGLLVGVEYRGAPIAERDSNGNIVIKLDVGTHDLDEEWGVYGVHDKDGWTLEKIVTERIPLP